MKVLLIKPSNPSPFKEYKKYMAAPPQNIFSVAATTPPGVEIEMVDETMNMKTPRKTDANIVALFMSTPDAIRGYEIADKFRQQGKTVVFGGLHASFLPDEALEHGDAVLIGEQEGIWEELLEDFRAGKMKRTYQRTEPVDLATVKPYPTHLIKPWKYNGVWSVVVSRGCPNKCSYCTVNPFFQGQRFRPIPNILEEIKASGCKTVELKADNLTIDREYAVELFTALKPLNIRWVGETTLSVAKDDELLRLMAESGLIYLLVGLETPSQGALKGAGKGFVDAASAREMVAKIQAHGIAVDSAFLFGFDEHTPEIFDVTADYAGEVGLDVSHAVIVTPYAGTRFFKKLDEEGRILTKDWSKYDGRHAVYQPKGMTAEQLEEGTRYFDKKIQPWVNRNYPKVVAKFFRNNPTQSASKAAERSLKRSGSFKWKTLIGIGCMAVATVSGWTWFFGILFLIWAINDIITDETHFLEEIRRDENPALYYILITFWVLFAALYLIGIV